MARYAFNSHGEMVVAANAVRSVRYSCIECRAPMGLRVGSARRSHFFHLNGESSCRCGGKTAEHAAVQNYLQQLIGEDAVEQEVPFPEISRIADLCWREKKVIYEVQCSPITGEEIEARNRDYGSLGYRVIWILHERQFRKQQRSEAENYLEPFAHYTTDIDASGRGQIYDWPLAHGGRKRRVNPTRLLRLPKTVTGRGIPHWVSERLASRPLHLDGDYTVAYLRGEIEGDGWNITAKAREGLALGKRGVCKTFGEVCRFYWALLTHLLD